MLLANWAVFTTEYVARMFRCWLMGRTKSFQDAHLSHGISACNWQLLVDRLLTLMGPLFRWKARTTDGEAFAGSTCQRRPWLKVHRRFAVWRGWSEFFNDREGVLSSENLQISGSNQLVEGLWRPFILVACRADTEVDCSRHKVLVTSRNYPFFRQLFLILFVRFFVNHLEWDVESCVLL